MAARKPKPDPKPVAVPCPDGCPHPLSDHVEESGRQCRKCACVLIGR